MNAVKVDSASRVRLKILKPGDYYAVEHGPNQITLRRIEPPKPKGPKRTAAEVARAIKTSKLKFGISYNDLRKLTRD